MNHTALMIATFFHNSAMVRLLIANNANLNTMDTTKHTALHIAQRHDFTQCAQLLERAMSK